MKWGTFPCKITRHQYDRTSCYCKSNPINMRQLKDKLYAIPIKHGERQNAAGAIPLTQKIFQQKNTFLTCFERKHWMCLPGRVHLLGWLTEAPVRCLCVTLVESHREGIHKMLFQVAVPEKRVRNRN